MRTSITIAITGEAGQGLATAGEFLSGALTDAGYSFITYQGYHSRIRGGHNQFYIRISENDNLAPEDGFDLLLPLNEANLGLDLHRVRSEGYLITSKEVTLPNNISNLKLPFLELGPEREKNLIALGALAALLGLGDDFLVKLINRVFKKESILQAFQRGFAWGKEQNNTELKLKPAEKKNKKALMAGNEALALGLLSGGIKFCSFYPMTPGTSVALSLADWSKKVPIIVEQAEDEIAAINMAIGASYAGAPAMISTSGGGFALMSEGVSLSAMTETPLVLVVVQRPGPATGLPTRTEQADLNLVLHAGHGEFAKAILAPSCPDSAFRLGAWAVYLAEESQGPVFILSDQFLTDSKRALNVLDTDLVTLNNPLKNHEQALKNLAEGEVYQRYKVTDNGISPRLLPGYSSHNVKADSDEHTPMGYLTEDLVVRVTMQEKRLKKMEWLKENIIEPKYFGAKDAEYLLVSWGSSLGAVKEAAQKLTAQGKKTAVLHFIQVWPLNPAGIKKYFEKVDKIITVESNAGGQFSDLLKLKTGFEIDMMVLKYDGLPLTADYIMTNIDLKGA